MQVGQGVKGRGLRFKSTDGTVFWVNGDSCIDYVLHPVFLHYFTLCILVFALLDPSNGSDVSNGWHLAISWALVLAISITWLGGMTWVVRWLWRRRWITLIYNPLFLVPMVLIVDLSRQYFATLVGAAAWKPLPVTILDISRDIFAVLLLDILHGRYVVLAHPQATPESDMTAAPPPRAGTEAPAAQPAPAPADTLRLRIGSTDYPLAEVLTIRTRDHRLEVATRHGTSLHRARMADLPEGLLVQHGIQISRSLWVAFDAITDVVEADGPQTDLRLWTGETERVARPRLHAFRQAWRARNTADGIRPDRQNPARPGGNTQPG